MLILLMRGGQVRVYELLVCVVRTGSAESGYRKEGACHLVANGDNSKLWQNKSVEHTLYKQYQATNIHTHQQDSRLTGDIHSYNNGIDNGQLEIESFVCCVQAGRYGS